jgi:hypothetical protein
MFHTMMNKTAGDSSLSLHKLEPATYRYITLGYKLKLIVNLIAYELRITNFGPPPGKPILFEKNEFWEVGCL